MNTETANVSISTIGNDDPKDPQIDNVSISTSNDPNIEYDHDEEEEQIDFSTLSKDGLYQALMNLAQEHELKKIDKNLREIRIAYDELHKEEKDAALEKFINQGGEKDSFEFLGTDVDRKFETTYQKLKDHKIKLQQEIDKKRGDNLRLKKELLEKLKMLVEGEDNPQAFKDFKLIQESWKSAGPVAPIDNKELWSKYKALVDRYYDNHKIAMELKDLDRKKNLEAKLDLCIRAEKLEKLENVKEAVQQLNELHEEFKHIGPVPKEHQEALWLRFKTTSDLIYSKRKVLVERLKEDEKGNADKKEAILLEIEKLALFQSDKINEWNIKTKELLDYQKQWEHIGNVSKEKAKKINKRFWVAFKGFFNAKNAFFKTLEKDREQNLKLKEELINEALNLKDLENSLQNTEKIKSLQAKWKEIGPVPEKIKDELYNKFKSACDVYFNRRRNETEQEDKQQKENLKKKEAICERLKLLSEASEWDFDAIYEATDEFAHIGFVPKKAIKTIQNKYQEVMDGLMQKANATLSETDFKEFTMNLNISKMRSGPFGDQKMNRMENSLKRRISSLENDINTWQTNLDFFAKSATATQLRKDFEVKISKAVEELDQLKKQLRSLRQS